MNFLSILLVFLSGNLAICFGDSDIAESLAKLKDDFRLVKGQLQALERKFENLQGTKDLTTFFLGGGLPESSIVEVFQLSSSSHVFQSPSICRKRSGLHFEEDYGGLAHPVVANFGTYLLVCGGSWLMSNVKSCRSYNFSLDKWNILDGVEMNEARYQAESVRLDDEKWLIVGGTNGNGTALDSTEIYDPETMTFKFGPVLPKPSSELCFVKLNGTHFFFTSADKVSNDAWIFNFPANQWNKLPNTKRSRYRRSICGYVERRGFLPNEVIREVIVAGGAAESFAHRATELLDLQTLQWRTGPPLPEGFSTSALFANWKNSFFILGGSENEVYEYVEELWVKRRERLRRKRKIWKAFLVEVPNTVC